MPPPDELPSQPLPSSRSSQRRASKARALERRPGEVHTDTHTDTDTHPPEPAAASDDASTPANRSTRAPASSTDSAAAPRNTTTTNISPVRRRLVGGIITVVACLIILRVSVVAWRMAEDKQPAQREKRALEITRWMEQVHGNPQARVLSIGDARHTFWTSNFMVNVLISEPNKPGDQGYSFIVLTFDTTGKIIGSTVKRPN